MSMTIFFSLTFGALSTVFCALHWIRCHKKLTDERNRSDSLAIRLESTTVSEITSENEPMEDQPQVLTVAVIQEIQADFLGFIASKNWNIPTLQALSSHLDDVGIPQPKTMEDFLSSSAKVFAAGRLSASGGKKKQDNQEDEPKEQPKRRRRNNQNGNAQQAASKTENQYAELLA